MNWNRNELFELVKQRHGIAQAELLLPALKSSVWKFFIAEYHSEESRNVIKKSIVGAFKEEFVEFVNLILEHAVGTEKGKEFAISQFQAEAHMIACAQSLHSVADIFSQIIYFSLTLDNHLPKPIPEKRRYLKVINKEISKITTFINLNKEIDKLLRSSQFEYLNAYVNTTKHRSLILANFSVAFEETKSPTSGLIVSNFEYEGKKYPSKFAKDLLEDDFQSIRNYFNEIGNEINLAVNLS